MKIAFIGAGAMGEAMLSAILDRGLSTARSIRISDVSEARLQNLSNRYGVSVTGIADL